MLLRKWNFNKKQTYKLPMDGFKVTGYLNTPGNKSFALIVEIASNPAKTEFKVDYLDKREEEKPIVEQAVLTFLVSPEFLESAHNTKDVRDAYMDFIARLYNRYQKPPLFSLRPFSKQLDAVLAFAVSRHRPLLLMPTSKVSTANKTCTACTASKTRTASTASTASTAPCSATTPSSLTPSHASASAPHLRTLSSSSFPLRSSPLLLSALRSPPIGAPSRTSTASKTCTASTASKPCTVSTA